MNLSTWQGMRTRDPRRLVLNGETWGGADGLADRSGTLLECLCIGVTTLWRWGPDDAAPGEWRRRAGRCLLLCSGQCGLQNALLLAYDVVGAQRGDGGIHESAVDLKEPSKACAFRETVERG